MYVCLWSPDWSTGAASDADLAAPPPPRRGEGGMGGAGERPGAGLRPQEVVVHLADEAPRLRAESEVIWADGSGLDAAALARRLLDCLAGLGVEARAGVAAVPVAAELAARWGPREEEPGPIPFLVKERTGFGWRQTSPTSPLASPPRRGDVGEGGTGAPPPTPRPRFADGPPPPIPPSPARNAAGPEAGKPPRTGGNDEPGVPPSGRRRGRVVVVAPGRERTWLADLPLVALGPDDRLRTLMDGVGLITLGGLAALEREAVEVRFGPAAVGLWRLARADDRRVLFRRIPPERPHGSIDFVDYVLTDPARLVFTANALLGPLCERLATRGEHARALRLVLPLADGTEWERVIRPARPTASRETWLRLIRGLLDRLTVPDAVAGMRLELGATEEAAVRQGDLFDRGFATAAAVEAAVARLAERRVRLVEPEADAHPLLERQVEWREPADADGARRGRRTASPPEPSGALTLQLLPEPRRLRVETVDRRDHEVPVRLRDRRGWREVVLATGPDRISGGQWEPAPYAREYYSCVTEDGVLLWVYRDARDGHWFLHGWWD